MPSKKGQEQALRWLRNKAAEKNTLDGINAELCINVIYDLQRQYDRLAIQFVSLKSSKRTANSNEKEEQLHFSDI